MRRSRLLFLTLAAACFIARNAANVPAARMFDADFPNTTFVENGSACNATQLRFESEFLTGRLPLSIYLSTLKTLGCPQLLFECQTRRFVISEFTRLLYDRFCEPALYRTKCEGVLNRTFVSFPAALNSSRAEGDFLSENVLEQPCVQVALFSEGRRCDYAEIFYFDQFPLCGFVHCGMDFRHADRYGLAPWFCMTLACRRTIKATSVLLVLFAISSLVANATIQAVFIFNRSYRKRLGAYGLYRMSSAAAETLLAVTVMPFAIFNVYRAGTFGYLTDCDHESPFSYDSLFPDKEGQRSAFTEAYLAANGVCVMFSALFRSGIYVFACFDMLRLITRPLKYSHDKAKMRAKQALAFIAVTSMITALLPAIIPDWGFRIKVGVVAIPATRSFPYMFTALGATLVAVIWTINGAAIFVMMRHARQRGAADLDHERRLGRMLIISAAVYTLRSVPVIVLAAQEIASPAQGVDGLRQRERSVVNEQFNYACLLVYLFTGSTDFLLYNQRCRPFRTAMRRWAQISWKRGKKWLHRNRE